MPERGSFSDKAKEVAKKGGLLGAAAGGALFLVSGTGLALFMLGAGTWGGVKYLESRGQKR